MIVTITTRVYPDYSWKVILGINSVLHIHVHVIYNPRIYNYVTSSDVNTISLFLLISSIPMLAYGSSYRNDDLCGLHMLLSRRSYGT